MLTHFFDDIKLVRRTDPATSRAAAKKCRIFANSHKAKILDALREHGAKSAKELEPLTGLTVVQIDRRITEMRDAGLIEVQTKDGLPVERLGCQVLQIKGE